MVNYAKRGYTKIKTFYCKRRKIIAFDYYCNYTIVVDDGSNNKRALKLLLKSVCFIGNMCLQFCLVDSLHVNRILRPNSAGRRNIWHLWCFERY